jgi:predicted SAM-dependent methyltransferase
MTWDQLLDKIRTDFLRQLGLLQCAAPSLEYKDGEVS